MWWEASDVVGGWPGNRVRVRREACDGLSVSATFSSAALAILNSL